MATFSSENFMWSETDVLGKGSTATVYKGRNKICGKTVAIKCYNQNMHMLEKLQFREFEILSKLDHENIIKLLAIEEDLTNKSKIMVMEFCAGGSLLNNLQEPDNVFGLHENEFVQLLGDLLTALKYLKDNNVAHRDIKPGNIMRAVREDGTTLYKLTDFGAARELKDEESFQSIYGTEEYIRPDVYERALLTRCGLERFHATVDLWSLGATLYHAATGDIPFRAYQGRKDRMGMYNIINNKGCGVISGKQTEENGIVQYSESLPTTCQLSDSMKSILTPLLAGLLENDKEKWWSFDTFFKEVVSILSRKKMHVFNVNNLELLTLYVPAEYDLSHLQEFLADQTGVFKNDQILFYDSTPFINDTFSSLEEATIENPLFLFNIRDYDITFNLKDANLKFDGFNKGTSLENDLRRVQLITCTCKRNIKYISSLCQLLHKSVDYFNQHLLIETNYLSFQQELLNEKIKVMLKYFQLAKYINKLSNIENNADLNNISLLNKIDLYKSHIFETNLKRQWKIMTKNIKMNSSVNYNAQAKTYVKKIRNALHGMTHIQPERFYNEQMYVTTEQRNITYSVNCLIDLMRNVKMKCSELVEIYSEWFKMAQSKNVQVNILKTNFSRENQTLDECINKFDSEREMYERKFQKKLLVRPITVQFKIKQMDQCIKKINLDALLNENNQLICELNNMVFQIPEVLN